MMKGGGGKETLTASFLRFLLLLLLPLTAFYFLYTLQLLLTSASSAASNCVPDAVSVSRVSANLTAAEKQLPPPAAAVSTATTLQHVVFGIAASSRFWDKRKEYIKVWWRPRGAMRGYVWLDRKVRESNMSTARTGLPDIRISSDTSAFPYTHRAQQVRPPPALLHRLPIREPPAEHILLLRDGVRRRRLRHQPAAGRGARADAGRLPPPVPGAVRQR
uniref:Uncharacterized protein n=1 Tax=Zea mays TaxID=4577 RepID=C4J1T3_MAIZE|nr:unknown [Zea mays]